MITRVSALLLLVSACAAQPGVGKVRFQNHPIVWRVDDRRSFGEKPEERKFIRRFLTFETAIVEPIDRALSLPKPNTIARHSAIRTAPILCRSQQHAGIRA